MMGLEVKEQGQILNPNKTVKTKKDDDDITITEVSEIDLVS